MARRNIPIETGDTRITDDTSPTAAAWQVIAGVMRASLATAMRAPESNGPETDGPETDGPETDGPEKGAPYVSLVLPALLDDGAPMLLLSDLSDHAKNLAADPRGALLFDGTLDLDDPLAGPRVTLTGRFHIAPSGADAALRQRFVARHASAAIYTGFADFRPYLLTIEHAHLVGGFGKIHWIRGADLMAAWPGAAT